MKRQSSTPPSRQARIYRKAAQMMERNVFMPWTTKEPIRFACYAIAAVEYPNENHTLCERMRPLFEVESGAGRFAWMDDGESEESQIAIDTRILALCFMAAMVEAGDA